LQPKKKQVLSRDVQRKPAAVLVSQRRGTTVEVKTKGKYGAGKKYTLEDVVRLCKQVEAQKVKLEWFEPSHPKYDSEKYFVPKRTMNRWLQDDEKLKAAAGKRGLSFLLIIRVSSMLTPSAPLRLLSFQLLLRSGAAERPPN